MTSKNNDFDMIVKSGNDNVDNNGQKSKSKKKVERKSITSSKYKNLKKQLEKAQTECNELRDQLLRKAAEFDNYRKRTEKEFSQFIANCNAELITELLPIVDDLERSIQSTGNSDEYEELCKGIELIYKNLMKILEKRGVKPIEAVGQSFDPEKHDALLQVDSNDHPSGTIVEEHLKGYMMNDRVLRHSQVLVSK
ncbi:MAG: nucleotide exchange factor GrpE [bacterium]